MRFSQTPENPAQPEDRKAAVMQEKRPSDPAERKTELAELLLSINHKLDELTSANQDLFRMMDSSTQGEFPVDDSVTHEFARTAISQEEPTEPKLAYRLSSLMDFLRQRYSFEECAVFLLKGGDANPEKLVSSGLSAGAQGLNEFEDEIRALWERGDIARAVGEKRRLVLPARSGGNLLIIPFRILGREDGFWVARFREESSPQKSSSMELPFWTELISACIENSRLKGPSALSLARPSALSSAHPSTGPSSQPSTRVEKPRHFEAERLFATAEISRAVVHEINNCLQVILGRTQLLLMNEKKAPKTPSNTKVLETVETNANRVCSILKDFSDHLHRQSGRSSGEGEVNVRRILESNLVFLQYILKSDKIRLEFDLGENLPPVCWDPGEFELVLLSLIWGLRDQLRAKGSIRLQASAGEKDLRVNIRCTSEETQGDDYPDFSDLQSKKRFRLASEILNRHQGELRFEKSGERKIHLSLIFPIVPDSKTSPEKLREAELSS
ncbi:MAG: hypothetical protein WBD64_08215 [Candidatus Zixiibacteriota bacterium]